jgi:magnesium chelatase family protein
MLKKVYGSAVFGVEAHNITIEVNVDKGIGYHLVGLPDNAIKESNFRIAAALQNNGYKIPGKNSLSTCLLPICAKKALPMTCHWRWES